jgi:hypothetical protein
MLDSRDVYQRLGVLALLTHHAVSFVMVAASCKASSIRLSAPAETAVSTAARERDGFFQDSSLFE